MKRSELQEHTREWNLAEKGNLKAIQAVIEFSPTTALSSPLIGRHIDRLARRRDVSSRKALDQVIRSFRTGLLRPKPGPHAKITREAARFAIQVQRAFDSCPINVKRRYANPAARKLDIIDIANHVSNHLSAEICERAHRITIDVLTAAPGTRAGFGAQVAAQLFHCSARHIRSLKKSL